MGIRELVQDYYQSLGQKDNRWQNMYTEDAIFTDASHTLYASGRAAVIQSFIPFMKGVAEVSVSQLIVENDCACAIVDYVYVNSKSEKMKQSVAELWRSKNDKLAELTIYFDLTAYRKFIQS